MGRENELYRDKIEVSLDGRQIFSLYFAGAVIVCTVFVIGVIVGKRVEARAHVDHGGSGAVGDPLAALDRLEAEAPLSFRRALRGGQAAGGAVDAEIAAMASAQQAAGERAKDPDGDERADGANGANGANGEEQHPRKADTAQAKAEAAKAAELAKAEAVKAAAKAKADELKAKAEAAKAETKAKAEAAKAEAASIAQAKAEAKAKAKAKKGTFTLQLSSFQERGEAETFLVELRSSGYTPFVVAAEVEGKGTFYRVRLGSYPSYDDAVKAKEDFERKVNRIAYVTRQ